MIAWLRQTNRSLRTDRHRQQQVWLQAVQAAIAAGNPVALAIANCDASGDLQAAGDLARQAAERAEGSVLFVQLGPSTGGRPGFMELLRGSVELNDVVQDDHGLSVMERGHGIGHGDASRYREVVARLKSKFSVVVFGLPAQSWVGRHLASLLDGVLLVVRSAQTNRDVAVDAKRSLVRSGARLLGVIVDDRGEGVAGREPQPNRLPSSDWVPSAESFRAAVSRERIRSDRTGMPFTLLIGKPPSQTHRLDIRRLSRLLGERLRETDLAGCWDHRRVGVLLPDTGPDGAAVVLEALRKRCGEQGHDVDWEVYTHPLQPEYYDRHGDGDGASPPRPAAHAPLVEPNDGEPTGQPPIIAAQSLERLLVSPLPFWKRSLDVVGSLCGLVLLSPLLLVLAVFVKASSRGPLLFHQVRRGIGGRPFVIYKFRTMLDGAEEQQAPLRALNEQDGPAFKLRQDPRVTTVGRFLRRTSLDELPQLWNVLRGDMTLVGPRPLPLAEADGCDVWHRRRLSVTPGLTCFWQVEGRALVSFDEWMRMDLMYIRRRSLFSDLLLLVRTVPAVLSRRGAH